jgi:hypothetical protein
MSSLGPRISTHSGWGCGAQRCSGASSPPHSNKNVNIYIYIYILTYVFTAVFRDEGKKRGERGTDPWIGTGVQCLLRVFQDEGDCR